MDASGHLYGTSAGGGAHSGGTVYSGGTVFALP